MKNTAMEKFTECRKLLSDHENTIKKIDAELNRKRLALKKAFAKLDTIRETLEMAKKHSENYFFLKALEIDIQILKDFPYINIGDEDIVFVKQNQTIDISIFGRDTE